MRRTIFGFCLLLISFLANASESPRVSFQTNQGIIIVELDAVNAPVSTSNFLAYVKEGYYEGTIFHRVIKDFMIQGGGFDENFNRKATHPPIKNEANNGLLNKRGTIAMARTSDPHSATAQFFINTVDNEFLDYTASTPRGWGYAVFGKVVEGMDVVDKIRAIPTGAAGPFPVDVPDTPIIIKKVTLIENSDENKK